jgi:hypothetical protein
VNSIIEEFSRNKMETAERDNYNISVGYYKPHYKISEVLSGGLENLYRLDQNKLKAIRLHIEGEI